MRPLGVGSDTPGRFNFPFKRKIYKGENTDNLGLGWKQYRNILSSQKLGECKIKYTAQNI